MSQDSSELGARSAWSGGSLSFGELEELVGFHLRLAQTAMYRDFTASLGRLGLSQREFAVLELIMTNPGVSQAELAAALALDRPAMLAVTDRLEKRGLLVRQRSSTDRRRQELRLSADGEALLGEARSLVRRHDRRFLSRFSRAEAGALVEFLRRIHGRDGVGSTVKAAAVG